jgi:hypothetical protein
MRTGRAGAAVVLLALLAACGSSGGRAPRAETAESQLPPPTASSSAVTPTAGSSSAEPSSAEPSSAEASPVAESTGPPPTEGRVHHLGDRVRLVTGSRMTVFDWARDARPGAPAAGSWWAADVEFCLTRTFGAHFTEPIANIRSALVVELTDERAVKPEADARRSDEVFAQEIPVVAGRCRRGELVFDVPTGKKPAYLTVTFSPYSWVRWQLT